jgi:regulator of protease activity HflC (stomatin/prohibitin superfamily)
MADITTFLFARHFRTEPTRHVLKYSAGKITKSGPGLGFWFWPLSTSIAEVPVDDREQLLMFQARSADFQDVTVQGVIAYRVTDPAKLAERVDFTIDLARGTYAKQPLERLSLMITQLAQQHAAAYITRNSIRRVLSDGYDEIRASIAAGVSADQQLKSMGLELGAVRVSSLKPTAELERALEMPEREKIQQMADQASFARRALAVENERAIQENELQNQIELARREKQLIDQRGSNELHRVKQEAEAQELKVRGEVDRSRLVTQAEADRRRIAADAEGQGIRLVEGAKVESERERMGVYRDFPQAVLLGLAARDLALNLPPIEHLTLSPEVLGPLLSNLVRAGTQKLQERNVND